jgi:hypothetical protein
METIEIISLSVNNTNQIEVLYNKVTTYPDGFVRKEREGRVWSPTDDIASDTLSGAHPGVQKLAAAYWTPDVVTAYSANLIAQAQAERDKQVAAIAESVAKTAEAETAQKASEAAQALAKTAADAQEVENKRLADALAVAAVATQAK